MSNTNMKASTFESLGLFALGVIAILIGIGCVYLLFSFMEYLYMIGH